MSLSRSRGLKVARAQMRRRSIGSADSKNAGGSDMASKRATVQLVGGISFEDPPLASPVVLSRDRTRSTGPHDISEKADADEAHNPFFSGSSAAPQSQRSLVSRIAAGKQRSQSTAMASTSTANPDTSQLPPKAPVRVTGSTPNQSRLTSLYMATPGKFRFSERRQLLQRQYERPEESEVHAHVSSKPFTPVQPKPEAPISVHGHRFTEDSFNTKDFNASEFTQKLTKSLLNTTEFDPRPLQVLFSHSLANLSDLAESVDLQLESAEMAVKQAENRLNYSIRDLESMHDDVVSHFKVVESRIEGVADTAVRIGERLSALDTHRHRADEARGLIEYFAQFNHEYEPGSEEEKEILDDVFINPDRIHEAAILAQKLYSISQDLSGKGSKLAKEHIQAYCSDLESTLLNEFHQAALEGIIDSMKRTAMTLFDFNGGSSCMHAYVTSRKMFFDVNEVGEAATASPHPDHKPIMQGGDPLYGLPLVSSPPHEGLSNLYSEIRFVVQHENSQILEVFPKPAAVMRLLMERIFEQKISDFVSSLLSSRTELKWLRTLTTTFDATVELLEELSVYDAGPNFNWGNLILSLFTPYRQRYMSIELRTLESILKHVVDQATGGHVTSTSTSTRQRISRKLFHIDDEQDVSNIPVRSIKIDTVENLIAWATEAIHRCQKLCEDSDADSCIEQVFSMLIKYVGAEYAVPVLDDCLVRLQAAGNKGREVNLAHLFAAISKATQTVQLIQRHLGALVIPAINGALTGTSVNSATKCLMRLKAFTQDLEERVIAGLHKCLDATMAQCNYTLSTKQRKSDFRPKDETVEMTVTSACESVCRLISQLHSTAIEHLSGRNSESFLTALGTRIHAALVAHIKHFSISYFGGMQLKRDLTEYHTTISVFKITSVTSLFEDLLDISNLFLVSNDAVVGLVEETGLSKIDHAEIMSFLALRADYKTAKLADQFSVGHSHTVFPAVPPKTQKTATFDTRGTFSRSHSRS